MTCLPTSFFELNYNILKAINFFLYFVDGFFKRGRRPPHTGYLSCMWPSLKWLSGRFMGGVHGHPLPYAHAFQTGMTTKWSKALRGWKKRRKHFQILNKQIAQAMWLTFLPSIKQVFRFRKMFYTLWAAIPGLAISNGWSRDGSSQGVITIRLKWILSYYH
jgi:hypothetical protein